MCVCVCVCVCVSICVLISLYLPTFRHSRSFGIHHAKWGRRENYLLYKSVRYIMIISFWLHPLKKDGGRNILYHYLHRDMSKLNNNVRVRSKLLRPVTKTRNISRCSFFFIFFSFIFLFRLEYIILNKNITCKIDDVNRQKNVRIYVYVIKRTICPVVGA